jgi:acetyltransferase-like isoleucine patch superfamily enzyme
MFMDLFKKVIFKRLSRLDTGSELRRIKRIQDTRYSRKYKDAEVEIGNCTYGFPNILQGDEDKTIGVKIGKFCSISENVSIVLAGNHRPDFASTYPFNILLHSLDNRADYGHPLSKGDVIIGNDVWIGRDAMILDGITIGNGAVIGSRALVTKDIPPYSICAGVPAKPIKKRFSDDAIEKFERMKWWDWPEEKIAEAIPLLMSSDLDKLFAYYESFSGEKL